VAVVKEPAPAAAKEPASPAAKETADKQPEVPTLAERCTKAFNAHRTKDVLNLCSQAIEASPSSASIAVMLAKTELDRGRTKEALTWAQKAVAIDADIADAYVFIGMAEQEAGHTAAAKVAYKRYLQLAPKGKYAAEIRSVVSNM
jgi:Flp pilus assembly protein TadD